MAKPRKREPLTVYKSFAYRMLLYAGIAMVWWLAKLGTTVYFYSTLGDYARDHKEAIPNALVRWKNAQMIADWQSIGWSEGIARATLLVAVLFTAVYTVVELRDA